jgi:hypothetical protein
MRTTPAEVGVTGLELPAHCPAETHGRQEVAKSGSDILVQSLEPGAPPPDDPDLRLLFERWRMRPKPVRSGLSLIARAAMETRGLTP